MGKLESKDWRWFFIFCAMSACVFIGIGGVLLAIQALIVMNIKSFFSVSMLRAVLGSGSLAGQKTLVTMGTLLRHRAHDYGTIERG